MCIGLPHKISLEERDEQLKIAQKEGNRQSRDGASSGWALSQVGLCCPGHSESYEGLKSKDEAKLGRRQCLSLEFELVSFGC